MISSAVTSRTSTHTIEVTVTGAPPILAGYVSTPESFDVTGACLQYENDQIAGVWLTTATEELYVAPDALSDRDEVPDWVRELVEQHRPST